MNKFKSDLNWSNKCDRKLGTYWQSISYQGRFVFVGSEFLQKTLGIDIILQGKDNITEITIDTKHRRKKYPDFFLEEMSCSVRGKEKLGWILKEAGHPDYIFYAFWVEESVEAYIIPFQLLRTWFMDNRIKYSLFTAKNTLNQTTGRIIPIAKLRQVIPTICKRVIKL